MTSREREILLLIKKNPMISQNELAEILNITRSSVSVHISNLMKKGFIKGKGYVINSHSNDVIVIGGSNVDITGNLTQSFYMNDSNPGKITMSLGGVARNIAENLAYLGLHVQLITALGDDVYGEEILSHCRSVGIDTALIKKYSDYPTSVYMQMMDHKGHLEIAISDMDIMKHITPQVLESYKHQLENAKAIVIDGNLEEETLHYLVALYGHKIFLDPVSIKKAEKVRGQSVFCMTPNEEEAKVILESRDSGRKLLEALSHLTKIPIMTLGEKGVAYMKETYQMKSPLEAEVKSVTGAGDAFIAGIVYAYMHDLEIEEMIDCGMQLSKLALESKSAVNPSVKSLNLISKESI